MMNRRRFLRQGATGLALVASPALLAGCARTAENQREAGTATAFDTDTDTSPTATPQLLEEPAVLGVSFTNVALDPHTAAVISTIAINSYIFEGLYGVADRDRTTIVPELAAGDPEQIDDLTYRVRVRDGALFHDGTPVTADDVAFSFNRILDPETASLLGIFLKMFDRATAVDDSTVDIKLNFPTALLKERLALVKVMSRSHVESLDTEELGLQPLGSGPYQLDSLAPDLKSARLVRYAQYNGTADARLSKIGFDVILEDVARLAALRGAQLMAMNDPPYQDVDKIASEPGLDADGIPSHNQAELIFNTAKPPFDDVRVRQAVLYAINRDRIREQVYFGRAANAFSHIREDHPAYKVPSVRYEHDPDRARSLLAEAGAEGVGVTLHVSNFGWLSAQAPLIQADLDAVGMKTQIEEADNLAIVPVVLDGEHDVWLTVTDPSIFGGYDADLLLRWTYTGFISQKMAFWSTPGSQRVEQLLDSSIQTFDTAERNRIFGEVQDIISEEAPIFTLHHRDLTGAWSERLDGPVLDPEQGVNFMGVRISS